MTSPPDGVAWDLAIDLGTGSLTAAVRSGTRVQVLTRTAAVIALDGSALVTGDRAALIARTRPANAEPHPRRAFAWGDQVALGGVRHPTAALVERLLRGVWRQALRGHDFRTPERTVLTHPPHWAPETVASYLEAAAAIVSSPVALPEPVAVAAWHGASGLPDGSWTAAVDVGERCTWAAVVAVGADGLDLAAHAVTSFGGAVLDEILLSLADGYRRAGGRLVPDAPHLDDRRRAIAPYRHWLSQDTNQVWIEEGDDPVLVTREEFAGIARERVTEALGVLPRALEEAGITVADLSAVYLSGGAARTPEIRNAVRRLAGPDVPVVMDDEPETVVVRGAVLGRGARQGSAAPWRAGVAAPVAGAARHGDVLFVASGRGLHALSARSGRERWYAEAAGLAAVPVVAGGRVLCAAGGPAPALWSARAATGGDVRWLDLPEPPAGKHCLVAGESEVHVIGVQGVSAVDVAAHRIRWTLRFAAPTAPLLAGVAMTGAPPRLRLGSGGALVEISAYGRLVTAHPAEPVLAGPAALDGCVYVAVPGGLTRIDPSGGRPAAHFPTEQAAEQLAVTPGCVYLAAGDTLHALTADTLQSLWWRRLPGHRWGLPVPDGPVVHVAVRGPRGDVLLTLDAADGTPVADRPFPDGVVAVEPFPAADLVIVAVARGRIEAVRPREALEDH